MFRRTCLLVCASILLASASPVPQDEVLPVQSGNVESPEAPTTELSVSDSANSTSDPEETGVEGTSQPGTEAGSETDETPDDNKGEKNESNLENDGSDSSDPVTETDESSNDSEKEGNASEPKSDDETNNVNDHKTESDTGESSYDDESDTNDSGVDSENNDSGTDYDSNESDDGDFYASFDNPEKQENISIVQSNGVVIRAYQFLLNDEEILCQELKRNSNAILKKCFNNTPIFPHIGGAFVSSFSKYYGSEAYLCQELISRIKGPVQVVCASNENYFVHESRGLPFF